MGERGKDNIKRPQVRVIEGGRASLERELLWLIALGGAANRIEELMRTLESAANHGLQLVQGPNQIVCTDDGDGHVDQG
jgi:hypothetical protein